MTTTHRTFLLEVGCEEIPATMVPSALADLGQRLVAALGGANGLFTGDPIAPFGSPRRLVAFLDGVREREQDRVVEVSGPPVSAAFDKEGLPTRAATGFAAAQGVPVDQLGRLKGDKGEVVSARKKVIGRNASDLLAEACPRLLGAMRFPKMMKWGDKGYSFVRPVQWIVALLDDQVVEFEFMGVKSGRLSRGHRFLAPGPLEIRHATDYETLLAERGKVIVRSGQRKRRIVEQRRAAAQTMGWIVEEDEALLEELVFLNEYPGVIAGSFPDELLDLPAPVLITAMKHHQKYFPARDPRGALAAGFFAVINLDKDPEGGIRRGNEWVLKARLADARFFWAEDRKRSLEQRVPDLARVTFHEKLGSNLARVERLERLAGGLALSCRLDPAAAEHLRVASRLCKADLTTGMVGEFPELQGIMGGIYARQEGLPDPVARAVEEHYLPTSPSGDGPSSAAGCLLAIADKMDLLAGCFGSGLIPKGSTDPFGLRRAAHGVCRILLSGPLSDLEGRVSLKAVIDDALGQYAAQNIAVDPAAAGLALDFIAQRLRHLMEEAGMRIDTARAVLAAGADDVRDVWLRAGSLTALRGPAHEADFESLATSAKRIRNILAQAREKGSLAPGPADPSRLVDPEEKDLYTAVARVGAAIERQIAAGDYEAALREIASLRQHVDRFFEKVLVMTPDESLRRNRLALLGGLSALLSRVADFSEIVVEGEPTVKIQ